MEDKKKKLYTLLVYSENVAGILNQVTAVFTRRQVNIESLNVSASSIPGVHKYTITAWSDEDQIIKIVHQIEKKIDVVKANYFTDDQLFIRESGLYKLATQMVLENPEVSRTIRRYGASIIEVNPTYTIVMKFGLTEDIISLFRALDTFGCVSSWKKENRKDSLERILDVTQEYPDNLSDVRVACWRSADRFTRFLADLVELMLMAIPSIFQELRKMMELLLRLLVSLILIRENRAMTILK